MKASPYLFVFPAEALSAPRAADRMRVVDVLAAIRRDYASGRLREVIVEYEPLSENGGDGAIFVARP